MKAAAGRGKEHIMNQIIRDKLNPDEKIMAHTWGKMEMAAFGGAMFPSQGILVATNQRILYFEKTHATEMEFMREMQYEDVVKFSVYPDIWHGLVGILAKMLHLQGHGQEPIRVVGPIDYKEFARYLKTRIPSTVKLRKRTLEGR